MCAPECFVHFQLIVCNSHAFLNGIQKMKKIIKNKCKITKTAYQEAPVISHSAGTVNVRRGPWNHPQDHQSLHLPGPNQHPLRYTKFFTHTIERQW